MTTRHGFLTGILALGTAPAIVRASSLMSVWVPPQELVIGHIEDFRFIETNELTHYPSANRYIVLAGSATVVISREVLRHG